MTGGNITEVVVRVGDTVRRSPGPEFAVRVLEHLEAVGYPYAPRHLGTDERGRDVLTFVPGHTTDHPSQRAEGAYALAGTMLRRLHDVTTGHPLAGDRECVVHGDAGPYNTIVHDGLPVAFVDWDGCRPGDRIDDLGYLAWTWCVLASGTVPVADQAAHLRELRAGYGEVDPDDLVAAMVRQQTRLADLEQATLDNPAFGQARRDHARRAVEWAVASRDLVLRHENLFRA